MNRDKVKNKMDDLMSAVWNLYLVLSDDLYHFDKESDDEIKQDVVFIQDELADIMPVGSALVSETFMEDRHE